MESEAELLSSLESTESQLIQIRGHLSKGGNVLTSEELEQLRNLESDLAELVQVTRDQLADMGVFPPLNEIITVEDNSSNNDVINIDSDVDDDVITIDDQTEEIDMNQMMDQIVGMRCRAYFPKDLGPSCPLKLHNAVVMQLDLAKETGDLNATVLYCNPITLSMKPCAHFLQGNCTFEDKCKFSHGQIIAMNELLEYLEPDFSAICEDILCLVKGKQDLWGLARITSLDPELSMAAVNIIQTGDEIAVKYEHLWPLHEDHIDKECDQASNDDVMQQSTSSTSFSERDVDISTTVGAWESHTKGIGSKLMLAMGYKYGEGLGKDGKGRSEPVTVKMLPKGKSLDHCMENKEDSKSKTIRKQKRKNHNMKKKLQKDFLRNSTEAGIFDFLNKKIGPSGKKGKSSAEKLKELKADSSNELNLKSFQLEEERKKLEKALKGYESTLKNHTRNDTNVISNLTNKAQNCRKKLDTIRLQELRINREQNERSNKKKSTVF